MLKTRNILNIGIISITLGAACLGSSTQVRADNRLATETAITTSSNSRGTSEGIVAPVLKNNQGNINTVSSSTGKPVQDQTFNPEAYIKYVEEGLQKNKNNMISLFLFLSRSLTQDPGKYGVSQDEIAHLFSTAMLFDLAFKKDSALYPLLMSQLGNQAATNTGNYPGTIELTASSTNKQDGKPMNLHAYYVNQNSNKTVVIHGGYRGNWKSGIITAENDEFYKAGYNLLVVDSRATGESGGDYITFGYFESDDVLYWINNEIAQRPNQQLILYGGSMGASTMMSTLSKTQSNNIKGIIENCGFSSIEGQLRSTYNMVANALSGEDLQKYFGRLDIVPDKEHQDLYINMIKQYYGKQLNMPLDDDLPVKGMKNNLPKLIIHGGADDFVPTQNAYDLANQSGGYVKTFIVPGAGHGDAIRNDPIGYHKQVQDYLKMVFDAKVVVRSQTMDGRILDERVLTGTYGDSYNASRTEFEGYTFDHVNGLTSGTYSEKTPVITYIYRVAQTSKPDQPKTEENTTDGPQEKEDGIKTNGKTQQSESPYLTIANHQDKLPQTGEKKDDDLIALGVLCGIVLVWGLAGKVRIQK